MNRLGSLIFFVGIGAMMNLYAGVSLGATPILPNASFYPGEEFPPKTYPPLVIPGLPESYLDDVLQGPMPKGASDDDAWNQQLTDAKSVSQIAVFDDSTGTEKISREYFFDGQGHLIKEIEHFYSDSKPETFTTEYDYDPSGNLASKRIGGKLYTYRYVPQSDTRLIAREEWNMQTHKKTDERILFGVGGRVYKYEHGTRETQFLYGDRGRVAQVRFPNDPDTVCLSSCRPYYLNVQYTDWLDNREGLEIHVSPHPNSGDPKEQSIFRVYAKSIDALLYYEHRSYQVHTDISVDPHGNWVKTKTQTVKDVYGRPGDKITTVRREITYRGNP